jgi:cell division septal protein FtsQ
MYLILFVILIIALIWLICFSPFLTISQIEISGAREERIQSIEQSAWDQANQHRFWLLSQSHLYLFDGNQFKEKLLEQYSLNEVQIKKVVPKKLKIVITEKTPVAVWIENDTYYLIDGEGWVINTIGGPIPDLVTIHNNGQPKLNNKRLEGQESLIKASIELKSSLDSKFAYLESDQIVTTYERNSITLVLKDGVLIYFTIDEPISSQLDRLDVLIKGQLKNQLTGISYIDLRFGDKVYYKQ